jgi:hypothetical protein
VNGRLFDDLAAGNQWMVMGIVNHFEGTRIADRHGLDSWVRKLWGAPRTFTCEEVVLRAPNGGQYAVPLFLFSAGDQEVLRPGWEQWVAADKARTKQEQESYLVRAQAQASQQDRQIREQTAATQVLTQSYYAGLFDLWRVLMFPRPGVAGAPLLVTVPARDSLAASVEAARRNPGYVVGPISRLPRLYLRVGAERASCSWSHGGAAPRTPCRRQVNGFHRKAGSCGDDLKGIGSKGSRSDPNNGQHTCDDGHVDGNCP